MFILCILNNKLFIIYQHMHKYKFTVLICAYVCI